MVVELALRVLVAAALLNLVYGRALAVQGINPSSQAQATAGEVDALLRQVLADRIAAKDIPDFGLLRGAKRIAVRSDRVGLPFALGKGALPALEGFELRLISTEEAQAEAERTQAIVPFIAIENLQIGGDSAGLWIGVDYTMPPDPKHVKMCCCSRSLEYRRVEGRWVFVRWGDGARCS
jgi:hypothetical protein